MSAPRSHPDHVVIIGGGASATLLVHALRLRGERPLSVTVVEERAAAGTGLAYSTPSASHLLNVAAGRMSGDAENSSAYVTWLAANMPDAGYTEKSFTPRWVYGAYLKALLAAACVDKRSPIQVSVKHGTATALTQRNGHWTVSLDGGKTIDADAVVVATGNAPPRPQYSADPSIADRILNNPWDDATKAQTPRDATVALIGSGLTAVDVAVELMDRGHRGEIVMISRHGLLPRKHAPALISGGWLFPPYPQSIADLMRRTRDEARRTPGHESWRTAIDAIRPQLPAIWNELSAADKARFLRHVRPFWEVHRHRMAPEVASRIDDAIDSGRLKTRQGRLVAIDKANGALQLRFRTRGRLEFAQTDVVINCTGPECDPAASRNPLIVDLLQTRVARPDPLHLGLDTDDADRLISADGAVHETLFAIGPVARGRLWEVTAVPEIRTQVNALARLLSPSTIESAQAYTI